MIAIVNLGPAPGNKCKRDGATQAKDPLGPHLYQVKINHQPKAVFTHNRGESLATCLRKAADACESAHAVELYRLVTACTEAVLTEPSK